MNEVDVKAKYAKRFSAEVKAEIIAAYNKGEKPKELIQKYKVSSPTLYGWLNAAKGKDKAAKKKVVPEGPAQKSSLGIDVLKLIHKDETYQIYQGVGMVLLMTKR